MSRPRLKRIRYIPGIISVIFLPLLFVLQSKQHLKNSNLFGITVVFADLKLVHSYPELFTRLNSHFPPNRQYQLIELNGDRKNDLQKIDQVSSSIHALVASKDTSNGIHFRFGPKSEYGTFIKALDVIRIEGAETYMPADDDLWLYNLPPTESQSNNEVDLITCGTSYATEMLGHPITGNIARYITKTWQTSSLIAAYSLFAGLTIIYSGRRQLNIFRFL